MYHAGWAWPRSTPYQGTKLQGAYFGGSRNPMAVCWPKSIKADKTPRPQFHHANDVVPTVYHILEVPAPQVVNGFTQTPFDGTSMTSWPAGESIRMAGSPVPVELVSRG